MRRLLFPDDPMMEAVTWAFIILLSIGFLAGFGVGIGVMLLI